MFTGTLAGGSWVNARSAGAPGVTSKELLVAVLNDVPTEGRYGYANYAYTHYASSHE